MRRLPVLASALLLGALAAAADAQQAGTDSLAPAPSAQASAVPAPDAPLEALLPVPEKPPIHQYRVGWGASAFTWDEDAGADDVLLHGFEVERDLASFLAARAQLAYGRTEFAGEAGADALETRLYLPEVSLLLQAPWGGLRERDIVPYALAAFGSLITDPDRSGVGTRSQNAFGWGAGVRVGFGGRLGVRGELRRYLIKLESPFDPASRESESIHNTRFGGSVTYAL